MLSTVCAEVMLMMPMMPMMPMMMLKCGRLLCCLLVPFCPTGARSYTERRKDYASGVSVCGCNSRCLRTVSCLRVWINSFSETNLCVFVLDRAVRSNDPRTIFLERVSGQMVMHPQSASGCFECAKCTEWVVIAPVMCEDAQLRVASLK